jgi:hypothetical protein
MAPAEPQASPGGPPAPPIEPGVTPPEQEGGDPSVDLSRLLAWVSEAAETTTPSESPEWAEEDILKLVGDDPPRRWLDLDNNDHFLEIVNRVYTELAARLRFDILVERERAGSLMDLG